MWFRFRGDEIFQRPIDVTGGDNEERPQLGLLPNDVTCQLRAKDFWIALGRTAFLVPIMNNQSFSKCMHKRMELY